MRIGKRERICKAQTADNSQCKAPGKDIGKFNKDTEINSTTSK
jgi:hypothetical protein